MNTYWSTETANEETELKTGRELVATFFWGCAAEEAAGAMGDDGVEERAAEQSEATYCHSASDLILT